MAGAKKILFPYGLRSRIREAPEGKPVGVFFGTDFYNLPIGSDLEAYAKATNQMLQYMRERLPGHELLYLPHPNEKDEFAHLNLEGFEVRSHTIGEVFLMENAHRVRMVLSTCSWASGSAYAMGYPAGIFLHLLKGCIADDAIEGYESYFRGFPDDFFIRSFEQELPGLPPDLSADEDNAKRTLIDSIETKGKVWFLATDPAYGVRAAKLARMLKMRGVHSGLLQIRGARWKIVADKGLLAPFDDIISIPSGWYTARPERFPKLFSAMGELANLPLQKGDTLVSFAHIQLAENCLLSWYPGIKKINITESRWYIFTYEEDGAGLPKNEFRRSLGVRFFNTVFEPLMRLHRTVFKEYKDGKVLNFFRYEKPLEEIYDQSFVLVPLQESARMPE
jgi:hypothetical protein